MIVNPAKCDPIGTPNRVGRNGTSSSTGHSENAELQGSL